MEIAAIFKNPAPYGLGIKYLLIVMIMAFVGSLTGCSPKGDQGYVPMMVGTTWECRMETSEPGRGKEKQIRSGTVVCRCVAKERIRGRDYLKFMTFMQGFPGTSEFAIWHRQTTNGIYVIKLKQENPESLLLPLPPKVGLSWTAEESEAKIVGFIEAVETVDVPERSYANCHRIKYESYDSQGRALNKTTLWLAKGIGFVKVESESEAAGSKTKQWLTKYSPAR